MTENPPTDAGDYRFAATYWCYGSRGVDFGPDLKELAEDTWRAQDAEALSAGDFYAWEAGAWVVQDVTELRTQYDAAVDAAYKAEREGVEAKPWKVWIAGPEGTSVCNSAHATREEAEREQAALPPHLRTVATSDSGRYRFPD